MALAASIAGALSTAGTPSFHSIDAKTTNAHILAASISGKLASPSSYTPSYGDDTIKAFANAAPMKFADGDSSILGGATPSILGGGQVSLASSGSVTIFGAQTSDSVTGGSVSTITAAGGNTTLIASHGATSVVGGIADQTPSLPSIGGVDLVKHAAHGTDLLAGAAVGADAVAITPAKLSGPSGSILLHDSTKVTLLGMTNLTKGG